jgi:peptidyl-prolyl cis-trans isomerase SurA
MKRPLHSLLALFVAFAVTVPVHAQETQQIEGIVAIVNDDPISFTDVRQRSRMLLLSLGGQEPTQEQVQQLTSQALDQLINEKLQLQEAAEYEVEVSDDDIANSLDNLARQSGLTRDALFQSLAQAGISPESLQDQTRADIAWRRIMGGLYGSRIRISENQINDRLDQLRAASQTRQYQLGEIFLFAPDPTDRAQAYQAAQSIKQQIEAGAPFELAAQRFSSAPTAATGGDMGWVTLDDLDPARAAVIGAYEGAGMPVPVTVDDGVYLMLVRARRDPVEQTSLVNLTRLIAEDGSESDLQGALDQIESCADIDSVAGANTNLRATVLEDLNVSQLGPEGQERIMATPVGGHTDIFAQSGGLAVMYVCDRTDGVEDLPRPDQIEDQLYSRQLNLVSDRSLRNLRREATIITR